MKMKGLNKINKYVNKEYVNNCFNKHCLIWTLKGSDGMPKDLIYYDQYDEICNSFTYNLHRNLNRIFFIDNTDSRKEWIKYNLHYLIIKMYKYNDKYPVYINFFDHVNFSYQVFSTIKSFKRSIFEYIDEYKCDKINLYMEYELYYDDDDLDNMIDEIEDDIFNTIENIDYKEILHTLWMIKILDDELWDLPDDDREYILEDPIIDTFSYEVALG